MKHLFLHFNAYHKTYLIIGIVAFLSLANLQNVEPPKFLLFKGADKIVHSIMYFGLTLTMLLEMYLHHKRQISLKLFILNLMPFSISLLFECLQEAITNYRTGSLADILFNILGILVANLLFFPVKNKTWILQLVRLPFKVE